MNKSFFSKYSFLFLIYFFLTSQFVSAQLTYSVDDVSYISGDKFKKPTKEVVTKITEKYIYTTGIYYPSTIISKFNSKTLETLWSVKSPLQKTIKGVPYYYFTTHITKNGYTHIIYKGFKTSDKMLQLLDVVFDENGNEVESKILIEVPGKSKDDVNVSYSRERGEEFFAFRTLSNLKKNKEKVLLTVFWFNGDLELIDSKSNYLQFNSDAFAFQSEVFDTTSGNYFIVYRELHFENIKNQLYLEKLDLKGDVSSKIIEPGELNFGRCNLALNHALKQVMIHGTASEKSTRKFDRHFLYSFDKKDLNLKHKEISLISENLVNLVVDSKNLDQKVSQKNKSANFELKHFCELENQSTILIYEDRMANTHSAFLIFCYDELNQLKWSRPVVNQSMYQAYQPDDRKGTFMCFVSGNELKLYTTAKTSYMKKRYTTLKGLEKAGNTQNSFIEVSIDEAGKVDLRNLFTHKAGSDISWICQGSFYANNNPKQFYFTTCYAGGSYYDKVNLVRLDLK